MPFSVLEQELSATAFDQLIIGFVPLSQTGQFWPRELGERTQVETVDSQGNEI